MKISIRWTLILGFLGLIWVTQITITSSTYLTSENVLSRHATDIMKNIVELTKEQTENHLALAHSATDLTKRLIESRVVGDSQKHIILLEKFFIDQLMVYPNFAGIYIGSPDGSFFYVNRNPVDPEKGFRTKIISHSGGERTTRIIWRDTRGRFLSDEVAPEDTYDPRQRPWYELVQAQKTIVWTDPYIFYTSQKPGITIAGPIYDQESQLQAVVGVDLQIDQLSDFISHLRIGKSGFALMFNNNGDIVAYPDPNKLRSADSLQIGKSRLVKIDELTDDISKTAFKTVPWTRDALGRIQLTSPRIVRFDHEGENYLAMFTPSNNAQCAWIIGVFMPEKDYMGELQANRRANLLVTVALSVFATAIGLWLARGILRPLAGLEKEAIAIKQQNFTQEHDTHSIYKELQETADSFKRMKQAIINGEEKYRCIFENIQDVYYEISPEGRVLEISPSIEKLSLFKREEILDLNYDIWYANPKDREKFLETITAKGTVVDYELELRDKNGDLRYCAINAVLITDIYGNPTKVIGSLRDTHDRKLAEIELRKYQTQLEELVQARTHELEQANTQLRQEIKARKEKEAQLLKSEEKYRSIIENMDNGYYEMDLSGNLTFFNDPLVEILGYPQKEMSGLHYTQYISGDDQEALRAKFTSIRKTGIPEKLFRYTIIRKDGERKTVEASTAIITGNNGEKVGYRGVVMDITNRLKAEEEKKKLEERFQQIQRLESIGTLAGGVAHDFNNLLMGIQGNVSLMFLEVPRRSRLHERLKSIESCVTGGSDLTRQLLGFARGGKYVVKPLNLNKIVSRAIGMFGRARKDLRIIEKLEEDIQTVMADQRQMEQVLLNLCINAWQAMPDGGTIEVQTRNVVLEKNFAQSFKVSPGQYVRLSVTDTGIGMNEEVQKRIFEPFFTTKEVGRGTGLGLASTYGIVKNHDGAIDFVSQPGQGTTFHIYLPASKAAPEGSRIGPGAPLAGSGTILLVEDEKMILNVNHSMLEKLGYAVIPADGGVAAMALFDSNVEQIDLVLLDMIMPDLSGAHVFDHMRSIRPGLKILLCSGYSLTTEAEKLLSQGDAAFIQKPFSMDELGRKISEMLNGTNPTAAPF